MKMPPQASTDQTLRAENALLRARLEEAEATLRAIRAGDVDGLVVESDAAPQIFTLQGLEAKQNRIRGEMLAQVADAVIAVDAEERLTYLNAAAERLYGVRAGDVLGRTPIEIFTAHWPSPEVEAGMRMALSERGQWRGELIHRTPDGRLLHVEMSPCVLRGPDGEATSCVTVIRDIRERKQAEAALRTTNERLTLAVKCSQVVLFQQDLELRYIWLQNAAPGFAGSDAIGKRDAELMERAADAAVTEALKREVITSGVSMRQEVLVQVEGAVRQYDLLVEPERDAAGLIIGITGAAIDITERKRAEAALAERTDLLNGVLEGTSDVIFVKDLNSRVVLVNAAFAAAAGSTPEQLVGKTDEDWFPPHVAAAVRQQDEAVIAGGSPMQFEETIPVAGEVRVFLTLKAPLRDASNRVVGVVGIGRDITDRKLIELNLMNANAIAEKASRAKSDFLSSMSHELRTPLNAILGFAQLIESGTPAPTPAQKKHLDQILKGGWYLLDLINEILDLAVIESGNLSLTQEPVSLAEVMLECQAMIEPQAGKRGIGMTFPSFAVVGDVRADRTRVKQVVINLLSNAIKYNKAQGAVAVEWTLSPPDTIRIKIGRAHV